MENISGDKPSMKLSEAIRKGMPILEESRNVWIMDGCGCALGTAFAGYHGDADLATEIYDGKDDDCQSFGDLLVEIFPEAQEAIVTPEDQEKFGVPGRINAASPFGWQTDNEGKMSILNYVSWLHMEQLKKDNTI